MNIERENTGENAASLRIDVTPADFMPKVNESLEKTRKKASIPGFRPGKAPMGLVKRSYGKSAILDEINNLAMDGINNYITENKLKVLGRPLINLEKTPQIEDLLETSTYSFVFDIGIIPDFEVKLTKETTVEYKTVPVNDEALNKEIEALKKRHASFDKTEVIDEECMVTGHIVVNDSAQEKTEETEKMNRHHRYFYLDKLKENKKLYHQFLGKKTGENIPVKAEHIEDRASLAFLLPETLDFSVPTIEVVFIPGEMYTSKAAEMGETLYNAAFPGRNIQTEEEFRAALRDELQMHYTMQTDDIFVHTVRKQLLKDIDLNLPAEFVKRFLVESNKDNEPDRIKDIEERFEDYLEMIKWEFIQDKIFEQAEIKIGIDDFKEYIRNFYKDYLKQDNVTDEQIQHELKQLIEDQKKMDDIEASVRKKKILTIFKENLKVKTVEYRSFEEMVEKETKSDEKKPKKVAKVKKAEE